MSEPIEKESIVTRLDGQQIIARKNRFALASDIEEQRRFLSQLIDLLLKAEQEELAANGGNMQAIRFPAEGSKLDVLVGIFVEALTDFEEAAVIVKDLSFKKHADKLNCFSWQFYHKTIYPNIYYTRLVFDDE